MIEEKGIFEETVRSKLYDFETEVKPEVWDDIVAKLPAGKTVQLFSWKKYATVAAAVAVLSALVGGLYFFRYDEAQNVRDNGLATNEKVQGENVIPVEVQGENVLSTEVRKENILSTEVQEENVIPVEVRKEKVLPAAPLQKGGISVHPIKSGGISAVRLPEVKVRPQLPAFDASLTISRLYAVNCSSVNRSSHLRRWGFGVGGGQVGISSGGFSGTDFGSGVYASLPSPDMVSGSPIREIPNSESSYGQPGGLKSLKAGEISYPSDVKHRLPVSFGVGVNYYLTNRWTLQSGLVYTRLRSDWSINNVSDEISDYTQRLHFIGIPLSASFKLGEWKKVRFYASAGGMFEYNIAGTLKKNTVHADYSLTEDANLKMKEPYFSVHSRMGISRPVWRFIGVYAEAGVSYYFDNKSYLQTVRSNKPFNVSLQAGISLGF